MPPSGEVDLNIPPRLSAEFTGMFADARLLIQPGAGHGPWLDDASRFAATVSAFLDEAKTRLRSCPAPHRLGFGWSAVEQANLRFIVVLTSRWRDLVELGELLSGQLNTVSGDILLKAGHVLGAGDRGDAAALG